MIKNKNLIRARAAADNWQEAVKIAADLLYVEGYTTQQYLQGIYDNTKEFGPYYVIAPGIAIPHARADQGVIKNGISLITLDSPVLFGHEDCDPVNLIFCLSAIDADKHIMTIQKIANIIEDQQCINKIISAIDSEEILNILNS